MRFSSCGVFVCVWLYAPFGALQVRPVTQEVREEAVKFFHTGPEDAIRRFFHTLECTEETGC